MKLKIIMVFAILSLLFQAGCHSQGNKANNSTFDVNPQISPSPELAAIQTFTTTPSPPSSPNLKTQITPEATIAVLMKTQEHFMSSLPATLEARGARCKKGYVLELPFEILRQSNKKWTLFTCSPIPKDKDKMWTPGVDDYGARYTQITKIDLSQTWIIEHNTFDYSKINRPDALMFPYRWTTDDKYLYLSPRYYPGGSGFPKSAFFLRGVNSLYRINLETGVFELILQRDQFGVLSPDDRLVVYSEWDEPEIIHVRDMGSGKDSLVKLDSAIIASGPFVWNSDSTKIVFAVAYGKENDNWGDDISTTSIIILSLQDMIAKTILQKDNRMFIPDFDQFAYGNWADPNTIYLISLSDYDQWMYDHFAVNVESGYIIEAR